MKPSGSLSKIAVVFSAAIIGVVFLFSGFSKMVDPLGFAYKIQDYLVAWGIQNLFFLALPLAVAMSVFEFLLGTCTLLGICRRWTTLAVFALMLFMTPLTLWVAIKDPVKDCGCFGDALVISNWATFYKNLLLVVLASVLRFNWKSMPPFFQKNFGWAAASFTILFALLFALHNVFRMQVFDFRPYKIGASIPEQMYVDPEKADIYRNMFVYEKGGRKQEFTEENYPWDDSTWTFLEMKTELVKKGEEPKIEDFYITRLMYDDASGQYVEESDITEDVLADSSFVFLMTAYSLRDADRRVSESFNRVAGFAGRHEYPFYCLTSSSPGDIAAWSSETGADYPFCHADERALKTMNRSNPGLLLLKNGVIMNKWDSFSIPNAKRLEKQISEPGRAAKPNNTLTLLLIMVIFLLPLGTLKWLDGKLKKRRPFI